MKSLELEIYQKCIILIYYFFMYIYLFTSGKSVSTIRRVVLEGDRNKGVFSTPGKHRKGRPKKELDNFDLCAIRQKVQFFYTVRKQVHLSLLYWY